MGFGLCRVPQGVVIGFDRLIGFTGSTGFAGSYKACKVCEVHRTYRVLEGKI